jgi:hypothetical protein
LVDDCGDGFDGGDAACLADFGGLGEGDHGL